VADGGDFETRPVDEGRRARLLIAALAVLGKDDSSPLERQWAREVVDLCVSLGEARATG